MARIFLAFCALLATSIAIGASSVVAPVAAAEPAPAVDVGVFPAWTVAGAAGAFTASARFPDSAGFPATTVASDSTTAKAPSGESAYLGASTGFGQNFGSSRSQPYLYFSLSAGNGPSTTTIRFDGAPPAGWGFALGDIDADWVQVVALDDAGNALPTSVLNAQDTDNDPQLNYCNNVPKPSSCGAGPFSDVPAWLETGGMYNGVTYPPGAVVGSGSDTSGSYDWFLPSSDVRQLQLTFTRIPSGFPIFQFWLAARAPAATISGTIGGVDGAPVPAGTILALETGDGTPVLNVEEMPVTVPIAADGTFSLVTEQGQFLLEAIVPDGFAPIAPIAVDATTSVVSLAPITITAEAAVTPVTPDPPAPELAATGAGDIAWPPLWTALGAIVLGAVLLTCARRGPASRHRQARLSGGRGR